MYQLRFLLASPRKMSPHIFCHRDYRGQRTKQDDFHPAFNTYVCQPKGTQTSQDVMLELMQSAAAHQSAQQLFSVVELFDPETNRRMKLKGDEIILRPSDLQAAQEAYNATQPAPPVSKTKTRETDDVNTVNDVPSETAAEVPASPSLSVLDRLRTEIQANGTATATQLANTLGISATNIKTVVASENSGLQNKGGWISTI